jgi:hypothetical protein
LRLPKLDRDFALRHRVIMGLMRVVTSRAFPDVVKIHYYRYSFYGKKVVPMFHRALRGRSEWSVFEREVMAAFVSSLNQCVF